VVTGPRPHGKPSAKGWISLSPRHSRIPGNRRRGLALALSVALLGSASLAVAEARPSSGNGGTPVGAREVIGCTSHAGATAEHGPRSGRELALSFDDGPSLAQTPAILATLDRMRAKATFFEEGRHVAGQREALMRHILADGDEIGNHSYHHPPDPGYGELESTQRRIRAATGFTPCLFRPPYGLIDAKVAAAARRTRLEMVLWDVDSRDDKHPGVAAIRANAVGLAKPGSIVLMHDGGHHPQTVRALPSVIRGLRSRGFRFVTVTELLGGRFLFSR
jgi:peptidoglycan/xylan/chitin deacetylase (PgdA/CDA1 family)